MQALIFDRSKSTWEGSKGFEKAEVPTPVIDENKNPNDANAVLIQVRFAGVCGSDRGIWYRTAFKDHILRSLEAEKKNIRIIGHEFFGEVKAIGSKVANIKVGDLVSCESHVICQKCFQCTHGQENVCANQKILGISYDGGFAEFAKVPQHIVWKTDTTKIRPEIAAMQEPFGNAVHAASKVDLKGKTVAIFGLGPIGSFLVLITKGLGAKTIIGVDVDDKALKMGRELGVDHVIKLGKKADPKDYHHDQGLIDEIMKLTPSTGSGQAGGVDVAFEMAGFNDSVNNAVASVRFGGDVILFGVKSGDFAFEGFNSLVMKGITLHAVAGRQIWKTWEITRRLLEDKSNGIQDKLWNVLLEGGEGTILPFTDYTKEEFEKRMLAHTKILMKF